MGQLIDSSVFITLERRGLPVGVLVSVASEEPYALAAITVAELLVGAHRADSQSRRARRESFVEEILRTVPVISFDLRLARVHAELLARLHRAGQVINSNDFLIAATALGHGYSVLTDDLRHFQRVPGLAVHQPKW